MKIKYLKEENESIFDYKFVTTITNKKLTDRLFDILGTGGGLADAGLDIYVAKELEKVLKVDYVEVDFDKGTIYACDCKKPVSKGDIVDATKVVCDKHTHYTSESVSRKHLINRLNKLQEQLNDVKRILNESNDQFDDKKYDPTEGLKKVLTVEIVPVGQCVDVYGKFTYKTVKLKDSDKQSNVKIISDCDEIVITKMGTTDVESANHFLQKWIGDTGNFDFLEALLRSVLLDDRNVHVLYVDNDMKEVLSKKFTSNGFPLYYSKIDDVYELKLVANRYMWYGSNSPRFVVADNTTHLIISDIDELAESTFLSTIAEIQKNKFDYQYASKSTFDYYINEFSSNYVDQTDYNDEN